MFPVKCAPVLAVFAALSLSPARAADAAGLWQTQDGESQIRITPCGPKLCGTLVWLKQPGGEDGAPKRDSANADAALRNRPLIGVPLLAGLAKAGEGWKGKIYNPDDGKTYDGSVALTAAGTLEIKGCVAAIFCQTETLTRQ